MINDYYCFFRCRRILLRIANPYIKQRRIANPPQRTIVFGVVRCLGRGAVVEYSESGPPAGHRFLFCSVPAAHATPGYAAGLWSFIGIVPFLFVLPAFCNWRRFSLGNADVFSLSFVYNVFGT